MTGSRLKKTLTCARITIHTDLDTILRNQSTIMPCKCSTEGYAPDCPDAFVQNGVVLHTISQETQLKPRTFLPGPGALTNIEKEKKLEPRSFGQIAHEASSEQGAALRVTDDVGQGHEALRIGYGSTKKDQLGGEMDHGYWVQQGDDEGYVQRGLENRITALAGGQNLQGPIRSTRDGTEYMYEGNRVSMERFAPLKINGTSLPSYTIGGFEVDMAQAASKAKEVAPLPPSKLPRIFVDEELNFYHLFFQGMEMMLGSSELAELTAQDKYGQSHDSAVSDVVADLIEEGWVAEDSEITVFTKKCLIATFELGKTAKGKQEVDTFTVAANLYGFQYIESGMQLQEADMRMWLSVCRSHYKTLWFNTFKTTGVPSFAQHGVQSRYEEKRQVKEREQRFLEAIQADDRGPREKEHRRTKKEKYDRNQEKGLVIRGSRGRKMATWI